MMYNISFILIILGLISCNRPKCDNEIQDGNETGVDCGGDCSLCKITPTESEYSLEGRYILTIDSSWIYEFRDNNTLMIILNIGTSNMDTTYRRYTYEYNGLITNSVLDELQLGYPNANTNTHIATMYSIYDVSFSNPDYTEFYHVEYDNLTNKKVLYINMRDGSLIQYTED